MKLKRFLVALVLCLTTPLASAGMLSIRAAAAATATYTSADIVRTNYRGVHVILNVTVVPGGDTLTMKIQGLDNSGAYYDLLVGTAAATTGVVVLKVSPNAVAVVNGVASDGLPDVWRVIVTHSGAGSFTYSINANTLQ